MAVPSPERWRRLSALLDESLDLSESGRADLIASLRRTDPSLADDLAALHASDAAAEERSFLLGSAVTRLKSGRAGAPAFTLHGQRVGAYRLQAPLGRGGMGSVWQASREDGQFEGDVAIKLLHLSLLDHEAAQRFAREGTILARLSHPGIARLFDAGVTPAGQPYLVLELVTGERIDRHCDLRRLDIPARITLMLGVLDAVAYAHNQLIVHRDLKPSNILVDGAGRTKLLDFGIAKLLDGDDAAEVTREGARAMTPEYAAPEQLRGEPVGVAADVYALGVLLFRLLSGRHPTAPEGATGPELARGTLDTDPGQLAQAFTRRADRDGGEDADRLAAERGTSPQRLARQLSGDLQNVVAKCLRKAPGERYASVSALREDLRRVLAHEPVSARADSFGYRLRKFIVRHRGAVAAGALCALAIVAGIAGTVQQAMRANENARLAAVERDRALEDRDKANAAWHTLSFVLEERPGKPFTAQELLASAERQVERQYRSNPKRRGDLLLTLAGQFQTTGDVARAGALLERAEQAATESGSIELQAEVACAHADLLGYGGERERAQKEFARAFQLVDRLQNEPSVRVRCLVYRSGVATTDGHTEDGLRDAEEALALATEPHGPLGIEARRMRAYAHDALGHAAKAVADYEVAVADLKVLGHDRTLQAANLYNDFAIVLLRTAGPLRAAAVYREALEAVAATEQGSDRLTPQRTNLAMALAETGDTTEAQALLTEAMAVEAGSAGNARARGYVALASAQAWLAAGDGVKADRFLSDARQALEATLPPEHITRIKFDVVGAQIAALKGQPETARAGLQKAWAALAASDRNLPTRVATLRELARAELQLGDSAAALGHALQAVGLAEKGLQAGELSPASLGQARLAQAAVLQAQGKREEAQAVLEKAVPALQQAMGASAPATVEARQRLAGL